MMCKYSVITYVVVHTVNNSCSSVSKKIITVIKLITVT